MTTPPSPPVLLVDSSLYVFRAWRVVPSSRDARDRPVNAVRGFAAFLAELLADRPTGDGADAAGDHLLCAFDEHRGGGLRRELCPEYKAWRPPVDVDLLDQIPRARDVAAAYGVPVLSSPRVEADDIIGQLAAVAREAGRAVLIVSGDKDLSQYVLGARDAVHDVGRGRPLGPADVRKRFRVDAERIPDLLALAGDASDGIPGVPGVGEATAARLLKRWGDLDGLFANAAAVASMGFRGAPHVAKLLALHEPRVRLSRRLTGLVPEPGLPTSLDALRRVRVPTDGAVARLVEAGVAEADAPGLVRRASGGSGRA